MREPRFELQHTGLPPKETALEMRPILLAKSLRDVTHLADSVRGILIRNRVSVAPLVAVYTLTYQLTPPSAKPSLLTPALSWWNPFKARPELSFRRRDSCGDGGDLPRESSITDG